MYDYQKVWEYILDQIANGRTLTSIVAEPDMPSYAWCTLQLRNDPQLKERYAEAVDSRVEYIASEFIDLADSTIGQTLVWRYRRSRVQILKIALSNCSTRLAQSPTSTTPQNVMQNGINISMQIVLPTSLSFAGRRKKVG